MTLPELEVYRPERGEGLPRVIHFRDVCGEGKLRRGWLDTSPWSPFIIIITMYLNVVCRCVSVYAYSHGCVCLYMHNICACVCVWRHVLSTVLPHARCPQLAQAPLNTQVFVSKGFLMEYRMPLSQGELTPFCTNGEQ